MDAESKKLIDGVRKYKFLNKLSNPTLGEILQISPSWTSRLVNYRIELTPSLRCRIEDLLQNWESVKVVSNKSDQQAEQPCIQHYKAPKVSINAEVKQKLINKIAHKSPKMRSR